MSRMRPWKCGKEVDPKKTNLIAHLKWTGGGPWFGPLVHPLANDWMWVRQLPVVLVTAPSASSGGWEVRFPRPNLVPASANWVGQLAVGRLTGCPLGQRLNESMVEVTRSNAKGKKGVAVKLRV